MPIPFTTTRTSHAATIRVDGQTVGLIQSWNPQQSRTVTPVYELNSATAGEILEQVPGNIGGLTISVTRFDLYTLKMEEAWGPNFDINMLTDQRVGLEISENWTNPTTTNERYVYSGCWFSSLGRTLSATDDKIVKVNATLAYTRRRRFL